MEPKNTKECDKRKNHISSKLYIIYIYTNNVRHPVTTTFTTFNPTTLHYTSKIQFLSFKLHPTTLHYPLIWLNPFKFPTSPFHLTSLHFTSLHFTALLDDFRHTSIPFISPRL